MAFPAVPLHWISKQDNDFCTRLDCVDKVLGQERRLCILFAAVKIAPGLVVPHSGSTGFTCQDIEQQLHSNAASSAQIQTQCGKVYPNFRPKYLRDFL